MSNEDFSLQAHLRAQIKALAEPARQSAQGRVLFEAGEGSAVEALLREIDETVLRRSLAFHSDDAEIVLEVSERRLRRVLSADVPDEIAPEPAWSDGIDTAASPEIAQWLERFCAEAQVLSVKVDLCASSSTALAVGVAAAALRNEGSAHVPDLAFDDAATDSMALVVAARCTDPRWTSEAADPAHAALLDEAGGSAQNDCAADLSFDARQIAGSNLWMAKACAPERVLWMLCEEERLHELVALWTRAVP